MKGLGRKCSIGMSIILCAGMLNGCIFKKESKESKDSQTTTVQTTTKKNIYPEMSSSLAEYKEVPKWTDQISDGMKVEYVLVLETEKIFNGDVNTKAYEYDKQGRRSAMVESIESGSARTEYTYNDSDLLIREETKYEGHVGAYADGYAAYEYNDQGQIVSKKLYDLGKDDPIDTDIYRYDNDGHLIYERHGIVDSVRVEYTYENGTLVSSESSGVTQVQAGPINWSEIRTYDKNGNVIHYEQKNNDEVTFTASYEYDEHNNEIRCSYSSDNDNRLYETKFTYDESGNVLTKVEYFWNDGVKTEQPDLTIEYVFTYDENGLLLYELEQVDGVFEQYIKYEYEPILVPDSST